MDHHPSAVVTADAAHGRTAVYHRRSRQAAAGSQRTVQVWIRDGTLTAVRYGRLLRIRQADLAAFGEVLNPHTPTTDATDASPTPEPVGAAPE